MMLPVHLARSSADSIGDSILSTVRKAARLAVYELIIIKVKNHHMPATILVEMALGKKIMSLRLSLICSNSHYDGGLARTKNWRTEKVCRTQFSFNCSGRSPSHQRLYQMKYCFLIRTIGSRTDCSRAQLIRSSLTKTR